ncbi:hypothetical protein CFOL_v3_27923 [Cephalotus follicularis]|uniref:DUF4283 domain-containing protein n=1 Tax=Cephalotus follicularis TaxID=3775 RepID=A0A1Q3CW69_CEPFO|nr:hypothetical protein CFOL_v3_27923 [Cephalotus follicularis]
MAPRICVEMDLASNMPDEVVIAVGTEEIFHQKIEYDLKIGFCTFCHLQGHFEGNCRRKLPHVVPPSAEPSSSSPQGNVAPSSSNAAVVSAVLPAGFNRPSARRPIRTQVTFSNAPISHPPPVRVNAPVISILQPSSLFVPPDPRFHPYNLPINPPGSQPPHFSVSSPSSTAPLHPPPLALDWDNVPAQDSVPGPPTSDLLQPPPLVVDSSPSDSSPAQSPTIVNHLDSGHVSQPIALHNSFNSLSLPSLGDPSTLSFSFEPSNTLSPLLPILPNAPYPANLLSNASVSPPYQNADLSPSLPLDAMPPVTFQPNPSISPSHQNTAPPPNLQAAVSHPPPPQQAPAPSNPPVLFSPHEPALSTNPPPSSAAQQTLVMQLIDSLVPLSQPIAPVLYNAPPALACTRAARAILSSKPPPAQGTSYPPLDQLHPILSSQPDEPITTCGDTLSDPHNLCSLNSDDSLSTNSDCRIPIPESPVSISSPPRGVVSTRTSKKAKSKGQPKGSSSATKKGALVPSSS